MFWRLRSLILGVILGLLFSPGTGAENRRRLWTWLQGKAGETAPKVQSHLQHVAAQGTAVAGQTLDQARQQAGPMAQRAQEAIGNAGQAAQQQFGQMAQEVTSRAGDVANQVRSQVPGAAHHAQETAAKAADALGTAVTQIKEQAATTARRGLTTAEQDPKNVLREVDRAEAEVEGQKQ